MNYIAAIIFYTLTSSTLFIYGIGLERLYFHSLSERPVLHFYIKNLIFIFITSSVLWLFSKYVLFPLKFYFLLPLFFITAAVSAEKLISNLYGRLFSSANYTAENEKIFTYGTILFTLYNASSYIELIFIIFTAFLTLFLFTAVLKSVRIKIINGNSNVYGKIMPLTLISLGIIGFILYSADVSWILSIFL